MERREATAAKLEARVVVTVEVARAVAKAVAQVKQDAAMDKENALTQASEHAAFMQAAALEAANELSHNFTGGLFRSPWRRTRRVIAEGGHPGLAPPVLS